MTVALPLIADPATHACATCPGPCCLDHVVPILGYDLYRLCRGLGVPWRSLVELETHRTSLFGGFRLDRGPSHHSFQLRRRDSGACGLLLELPGAHRRCGVHGLRPGICRTYPLMDDGDGLAIGGHVMCPDGPRALYLAAAEGLRPLVDESEAEQALDLRLRDHWDWLPRTVPIDRPLDPDVYVEWLFAALDALEPLRERQVDRGEWQLRAYARIEELPLPFPA